MSGAGKTTIGRALYGLWRSVSPNTVLVDGDEMRAIFAQDRSPADYTLEGRRKNAERIYEICAWLDRQGINVVCCMLSVFPDVQARGRQNFSQYFEVFIDVPVEVLAKRDAKGLYGPAMAGQAQNVVGVDIAFPRPPLADMVVDNSGFDIPAEVLARHIARKVGLALPGGQVPLEELPQRMQRGEDAKS